MRTLRYSITFCAFFVAGLALADPPDWSVNPPSYEFTASMTGVLIFDGVQSDDTGDMVAAFVGDECRGVDDQGIFFPPSGHTVWGVTLYANGDGESFTFKGYDASEDMVYDIIDYSYSFIANDIVGNSMTPVEWDFDAPDAPEPPEWTVSPPDFEFTASMTGILIFEGVESDDPNDMVAAFVGDECRGVDDQGIYFPPSGYTVWGVTLYANEDGETFTFKGYDASEDMVYDYTNYSYQFIANDIVGNSMSPVLWSFSSAPVNSAPVANDMSVSTDEDTPVEIALSADDPDGDELTFTVTSSPSHGAYVDGAYIPSSNFNGTDSFTFTASDGELESNVATVTITVNPVNDPPLALGDSYEVDEDEFLEIPAPGITENDSDIDEDVLTVILVADVTNGSLQLFGDGSFNYLPNADFNGEDSFTYTAFDGTAASNDAVVTIAVSPVNDAPVADDISVSTDEDMSVDIVMSGSDIDGDNLSFSVVEGPSNGTYDGTTYTPNADFNGTDSFTYQADDGGVVTCEDLGYEFTDCAGNCFNDSDCGGGCTTWVGDGFCDDGAWGLYFQCDEWGWDCGDCGDEVVDPNGWCGSRSNYGDTGEDYKVFTPGDGAIRDLSNVATVTITVNSVNDAPVADAGSDMTITIFPNEFEADVTLDGSGSYDVDDEIVSYIWSVAGEDIAPGVSPTVSLGLGQHVVTLTVTDASGDSGSDDVIVSVEQLEAHWVPPVPTDQYHLIMLGDISVAQVTLDIGMDEIGVFDGDLLVGAVSYSGESGQQILAWADDETTEEVDGFTAGNPITFKLYDFSEEAELEPVTADYIDFPNWDTDGSFGSGDVSGVNLSFNRAPYFDSDPVTIAQENVLYEYTPVALDDDIEHYGDEITIILTIAPSWLSFDGTTLSGTPSNIDLGVHYVELGVYDLSGLMDYQFFIVEVIFNNELDEGWSWKGFPVLPADPMTASDFFGPVLDDLIIVKSQENGSMVNIDGSWVGGDFLINNSDGYIAKMSSDVSFSHTGQIRIDPASSIEMGDGWNWINYFGLGSPDAELAFGDILGTLVVAESRDGALLDSPWGLINGIGEMSFTEGYLVKVTEGGSFSWPSTGLARTVATAMDVTSSSVPSHFVSEKTLSYHLINVRWDDPSSLSIGDELAVFSGSDCIGSVVFDGKNIQQLLAWEATSVNSDDGFHSGDIIRFVHWDGIEERELSSEIEFVGFDGWTTDGTFQSGGMSGINVTMSVLASAEEPVLPQRVQLVGNFPNPFNPYTTIKYELSHDANISLVVYSSLGEVVQVLVNGNQSPGNHHAVWNGQSMTKGLVPSGIYIYQLTVDGVIAGTKKMVLVK
ncbi:MAG: hypothetical protein CMG69_01590 [Candidatus Marinimicrobia bacterium]|nr:hypothetical protein [Candidatus Neomarinimicrobiota bacterium]